MALVEVPVCEGREVSTLIQILLFFIPRFITEDVAVALRPDGDYDIKFTYYARFTALSADADTNWLLTKHPDIYLFASLAEAAPFMLNDERAPLWEAKYEATKSALELADDQSLRSGSALRVRAKV